MEHEIVMRRTRVPGLPFSSGQIKSIKVLPAKGKTEVCITHGQPESQQSYSIQSCKALQGPPNCTERKTDAQDRGGLARVLVQTHL